MKRNREFQNMYGPKYLAVSDLPGDGTMLRVRIGRVSTETLTDQNTGKPKDRYVVHFNEVEKGWILNKTNATQLAAVYGEFPDSWVGAIVELFSVPTPKGDGVRLRIIKSNGGTVAAAPPAPKKHPDDRITSGPIGSDLNDEIPPLA
jgi:hypothetical protein